MASSFSCEEFFTYRKTHAQGRHLKDMNPSAYDKAGKQCYEENLAEAYAQWRRFPEINPFTNRAIQIDGATYKKLDSFFLEKGFADGGRSENTSPRRASSKMGSPKQTVPNIPNIPASKPTLQKIPNISASKPILPKIPNVSASTSTVPKINIPKILASKPMVPKINGKEQSTTKISSPKRSPSKSAGKQEQSPIRSPKRSPGKEKGGSPSRKVSPKRSPSRTDSGPVGEEKIQTYHRLREAIVSRNYNELEDLLKRGADPNFFPINSEFYPVIFYVYDDSRAFELLIAHGASINVYGYPSTFPKKEGQPLLYYFIYPQNAMYNIQKRREYEERLKDNEYNIRRLIELGADVNEPWNEYQNILDMATEKLTREGGWEGHLEYIIDLLIRHGADPNTKFNYKTIPVIFAYIGREEPLLVEDLLKAGVDLNVVYNEKTPILFTVDRITKNFREKLYKILLLLITYGQNIYQLVNGKPLIESLPPNIVNRLETDIQGDIKEPGFE
jgi:hypothetical protein